MKGGRGIERGKEPDEQEGWMEGRREREVGGKRTTYQKREVCSVALNVMDGFGGVPNFEDLWIFKPFVTDGQGEGCHPNNTVFDGGQLES